MENEKQEARNIAPARMAELWKSGQSMRRVANILKLPLNEVRKILATQGLRSSPRRESLRAAAELRREMAIARQMYEKGYSTIKIGKAYGLAHGTVSRILIEGGVQMRSSGESARIVRARRGAKRSIKTLGVGGVFDLYHKEGMSCKQIGESIGASEAAVWRFMKNNGIPRRGTAAANRLRASQEKKRGVAMGNTAVTTRGATINLLDEKRAEREEAEKASLTGKARIGELEAKRLTRFEQLTDAEARVNESSEERSRLDEELRTRKFGSRGKNLTQARLAVADLELDEAEKEKVDLEKKLAGLDHQIVQCEALSSVSISVEAIGLALMSVKTQIAELWGLLGDEKN